MWNIIRLVLYCFIIFFLVSCANKPIVEGPQYTIMGGPGSGTFNVFAKEISKIARQEAGINIVPKSTEGSLENIKIINSNEDYFGIAYASHIYQAKNGMLRNNSVKYSNIRVIGYLYGAQAHLVVKEGLGINSSKNLVSQKVNVGLAGTGSFYHCRTYFQGVGIWNSIWRESVSDFEAATHVISNKIDAFCSISGYPNRAITRAAKESDIRLLDLYSDLLPSGFFDKNPYFTRAIIPANTYPGVTKDIITFQDSALLIAHRDVPDDVVKKLVSIVYSEGGIRRLEKKKAAARFMRDNNGEYGISTPLHSGAILYYKETGLVE